MKTNNSFYLFVVPFFSFFLFGLVYVFMNFPPLEKSQQEKLKLPSSMQDAKEIGAVVSLYTENYYFTVLVGFAMTYLFLQTFCIPGSIFLSFLAGTLFGMEVGIPLVCFLSACGASGAYCISFFFGRPFLEHYFPDRSKFFAEQINKHRSNIFNYFLFLRFSPLLPNWFVNIASPVFGVPFHIFWLGTFIGVSAQTFIAVKAGLTLQSISDPKDILDIKAIASLFGLAFLSLLPTFKPVQNLLDKLLLRKDKKQKEKEN